MQASKRNALIIIVLAAASGYAFYRADNFWGLVIAALVAIWSLVSMLPVMDGAWRFKVGFVVALFFGAFVSLWPTIESFSDGVVKCPTYVKSHIDFGMAQGLDLQGGMRLVYTVEVEEAIRDKRDRYADEMRQELATIFGFHSGNGIVNRDELSKLQSKVTISTPDSAVIRVKFADPADLAKIDERFTNKFKTELASTRGPGTDTATFKIRAEVESAIRSTAVTQAKDTVSKRIDELGLRETSVTTRDEDIIVEVPRQRDVCKSNAECGGDLICADDASHTKRCVANAVDKACSASAECGHGLVCSEKTKQCTVQSGDDDIKDIIRRTARLEFKMLDEEGARDLFGAYQEPDECEQGKPLCLPANQGFSKFDETAPVGQGKDPIQSHFILVRKQANETQIQCLDRIKKWASTAQINGQPIPDDHEIGFMEHEDENDEPDGWRTVYLYRRAEITGDLITDAQRAVNQEKMGEYYVGITFNQKGAERFEEVTGANVNRRFAIILDDVVDSAPVIRAKIGGGRASITLGAGDPETQLKKATQLELVLKSGALPAPISPSNESVIGPSLGRDAIGQGVKGMLVGSGLVLAFMILYYRKSGVVADVAVLFNLMLQMTVLSVMSATMTLPGIAGLALTIGMAVDANVLINERIREELRAGRGVRAAVEAGYEKAFPSIVDGHITLLISGLILAQFGTGPVKGFAWTLVVGILASLFTGVFCTRLVFDWWVRGAKVKRLSVGAEF